MIVIPPLISSFILCVLILLAGEGFLHFLFGCGRHLKNGRKCKMWSCPNALECPFYDRGD